MVEFLDLREANVNNGLAIAAVVIYLTEKRVKFTDLRTEQPNLEDVYLKFTKTKAKPENWYNEKFQISVPKPKNKSLAKKPTNILPKNKNIKDINIFKGASWTFNNVAKLLLLLFKNVKYINLIE